MLMGSSVLKMATLTFKSQLKDRLYYDQYEYNLTFRLARAGFLRAKTHELLDNRINWHNETRYKWSGDVSDQDRKNLHDFMDVLQGLNPHKLVLTTDHVYIYSNSTEDLDMLVALPYVRYASAFQAVINRPRDTLLLTDPQHRYRTYLKERYMTKENMDVLSKFLLSRKDCFRITKDLRRKLAKGDAFYTMSYYFVDHNNMEDLMMLQIVCPGIVRKTLTIQAK